MFGIGSTELLLILLVALVVLGPKSLAGFSRKLGKFVGEFRRVSTDFQRTLNMEAMREEAREAEAKRAPVPAGKDAQPAPESGPLGGTPSEEELRARGVPEDSPLAQALKRAREQAKNAEAEAAAAEKEAEKAEKMADSVLKKKRGPKQEEHDSRS